MSIGNKNKSDLNLYCQKSRIPIATYTSSTQGGQFVSKVCVNGTEYCSTSGYSTKKEAENDAAGVALIAILQKEFGGKSIEEALAILEQKHPSKNKKKSKQASSSMGVVAQSETQVQRDTGHSRVQTNVTSGGGGSTMQRGGAQMSQMPTQQQQQQNALIDQSSMVQSQSQIHSGGQQSMIVRPAPAQSGALMGQYQAAAYPHQHNVVRPHIPGALQQSGTMDRVSQQPHQQAMITPNQAFYGGSHSQQMGVQGQDNHRDTDVARSQGPMMVAKGGGGAMMTPKGGGGTPPLQGQGTQGQPSASSANITHPTGSVGQAPPTQMYAPPTAQYHYGYPSTNTAAHVQYYGVRPGPRSPYVQPSYVHPQAPPTGGHQLPHPHSSYPPSHPRVINSYPPGAYPPPSSPGPQTLAPTTMGAQMHHVAPPPGARSMAARFPGAATPHSSQQSQQIQQVLPSSQSLPPPPGFSADQSAASPPQTAPNKPLNAVPVTQLSGQGLPSSSTAGNIRQDVESANQQDVPKTVDFGHTKKLEELCKNRNLPAPNYKINEEKGKYFAEVIIGGQSFHTQWPCESFKQAKSIAAMEAITNLAMSLGTLSVSDTGIQQQSESGSRISTVTASSTQSQANPSSSLITASVPPPSQAAKGQSLTAHTQQDQTLKQQQTLSSGQQLIAVSPSNTTTTNNPPPELQPPSFFTNNLPNPPSSTTATFSTQVQPKLVKQDTQQPQLPASSKAKTMAVNYKQILNIHCQRNHISPVYECAAAEDSVGYIATVKVSGRVYTSKPHGTKRAAETDAAAEAVKVLGLVGPQGDYRPQGLGTTGAEHYGGGHAQPSAASQPQGMVSYKNLLQEHMQKHGLTLPHYEAERVEEGFKSTVKVHLQGNESLTFTSSPQPVKKGAEQEAARAACLQLKLIQ